MLTFLRASDSNAHGILMLEIIRLPDLANGLENDLEEPQLRRLSALSRYLSARYSWYDGREVSY